jgi:hypothetical protein
MQPGVESMVGRGEFQGPDTQNVDQVAPGFVDGVGSENGMSAEGKVVHRAKAPASVVDRFSSQRVVA